MTAKLYKFPNNYCPPTKAEGENSGGTPSESPAPAQEVSKYLLVARLIANAAIVILVLILGAYQVVQRVPAHMYYGTMPVGPVTAKSAAGTTIAVPQELLATDAIGRSLWSLVYYLDSESRVCAGTRCSGVQDAGLVVVPMDILGDELRTKTEIRIVPVAVSSKDLETMAAIEKLEKGGYPAEMVGALWRDFENRPKPEVNVERGFFFAKSGETWLHRAVSWFVDWMQVWGTDVGLALILAVTGRLMLRRREGAHA